MCNGFYQMCECEDCQYIATLYAELDFLEQFEPENKKEIERLIEEIENMGYSC